MHFDTWIKSPANPVLGGNLGTCFDACVLKEDALYKMWFSWRPMKSIAYVESNDGIHWNEPQVALGPLESSDWQEDINRPSILRSAIGYHMWYTGQASGRSWIGYAVSSDGVHWNRQSDSPVLCADQPWEKVAVMCPKVLWDPQHKNYRMWYSGGEQYEPDAIGYCESQDGRHWAKNYTHPVFKAASAHTWEQQKVTACDIVPHHDWYYMFYIGFRDIDHAQIGIARSRDGESGWERHPCNPIVSPTHGDWDSDACYKPTVVCDGDRWMLWYNGRKDGTEQIGLVTHAGADLWTMDKGLG